jgi:hypothetical protein
MKRRTAAASGLHKKTIECARRFQGAKSKLLIGGSILGRHGAQACLLVDNIKMLWGRPNSHIRDDHLSLQGSLPELPALILKRGRRDLQACDPCASFGKLNRLKRSSATWNQHTQTFQARVFVKPRAKGGIYLPPLPWMKTRFVACFPHHVVSYFAGCMPRTFQPIICGAKMPEVTPGSPATSLSMSALLPCTT